MSVHTPPNRMKSKFLGSVIQLFNIEYKFKDPKNDYDASITKIWYYTTVTTCYEIALMIEIDDTTYNVSLQYSFQVIYIK